MILHEQQRKLAFRFLLLLARGEKITDPDERVRLAELIAYLQSRE